MGLFKAYDIRDTCPEPLNEDFAWRVGRLLPYILNSGPGPVVVGRDVRASSPGLEAALIRGLTESGASVIRVGTVPTPVVYFATGNLNAAGGVMVTASHNPKQYNGFKICRAKAVPVSYESGLAEIEKGLNMLPEAAHAPGTVSEQDVRKNYFQKVRSFYPHAKRPLKIVADGGNGMAGAVLEGLLAGFPNLEMIPLFLNPDGDFPNHPASPLEPENTVDLQKKVVETGADLGVAFDGDADRAIFVDERGERIRPDLITPFLAEAFLRKYPGAPIVYDIRSSRRVPEFIEACGGKPVLSRVGHSFMKQKLREVQAPFAGEFSGHYYFGENFGADDALITLMCVLNRLEEECVPASQRFVPLDVYPSSGEINRKVKDASAVIQAARRRYAEGEVNTLDGIRIDFPDWWFILRASNTEPLLRLLVEARTEALLQSKTRELLELMESGA